MSSSNNQQHVSDTPMTDRATEERKDAREGKKPQKEVREPVLLQWKDREMAEDLSRLLLSNAGTKAFKAGAKIDMEDQCG
jgi:hypothetical protein